MQRERGRMRGESELCANHCMQICEEHDGATGDEWTKKRTRKVSKKILNSGIIESHSNAVTTSIKNSSLRCELIDDCNLQNLHDFAISHHQRHFCSLQMMQMWVVQNNSDAGYNLQRVLKLVSIAICIIESEKREIFWARENLWTPNHIFLRCTFTAMQRVWFSRKYFPFLTLGALSHISSGCKYFIHVNISYTKNNIFTHWKQIMDGAIKTGFWYSIFT